MISSLIAFLGGSIFRMLWGEISSWLSKKQDHDHELERIRLQETIDNANHERYQSTLKLQSDLGVKEIRVKAEAAIGEIEAGAWATAVAGTVQQTGIKFIDIWNGIIRPFVATWAVAMITINYAQTGWVLDENGWALASAALGIYLADRTLFKRGK